MWIFNNLHAASDCVSISIRISVSTVTRHERVTVHSACISIHYQYCTINTDRLIHRHIPRIVSVSVSVFYDLTQLQHRVAYDVLVLVYMHCILYHTWHCMRIWHMYTLRTLHQCQTVSACYDLLNYMREYQHGNNLTLIFSRPAPLLRPPSCFRTATSWFLYMWAQVALQSVQGVRRQRGTRAQASSLSVQGVWTSRRQTPARSALESKPHFDLK